ncbi:conjugal transfer protein TraJ [uncultured Desulfovibrio sp.]|uniref:plasmid mobilization protein n=1 Tax=uncultured Desulfovibrio sp. TaxID=167968 RepID=UPI002622E7C3|nr:conjugal transfer protein TraJ [uncultured Desulfovibrio sp.]
MTAGAEKPRRTEQIKAYVTPEEFTLVMESSDRAGLSMSEFTRRVCLGFRVESREDQQARRELLRVNADLGRLGGLLKQVLVAGHKEQIYGLLHKIDQAQALLKAKIRTL